MAVTEKGEEYFKDEAFDKNTYTDACSREFRNLNQGVIDDYIREQSKLIDKSHPGYIFARHADTLFSDINFLIFKK